MVSSTEEFLLHETPSLLQLNVVGREQSTLAAIAAEPPIVVWEFL